ncbi:hypothetical protein V1525DRAFT_440111 [Lipomyces kononenkoae]|uniref:Uncharacterized protein n=1 Tax=Lipomyces kononenkoae TaxID=34357 RepID=A0ACC3T4X0_LIPKO
MPFAPKGTSQAYDPIQRRFTFVDGQLVTESKPIALLQTELIDKGCRNRKEPYTVNTLKLHVAALTDLWKQQVDFGVNPHPRPRTANVRAILNTYSTNAHERTRQNYADRSSGCNFDAYNSEGSRCPVQTDTEIASRAFWTSLLGNYMLLRGKNRREIELADLYLLPLEIEGPTKCNVLVILLCNDKTNQHGRVDHAGAMRNQEVLVCPMFMLALHFFYRYHNDQEPFPALRSNDTWFDTKLFVQYGK